MKAIFTNNWLTSSRAQWLTSAEDHSRFLLSYKVIWSISLPFGWRSRKFQVNDNPEFLYFLFVISRELTETLRSRCSRTQRGNQACPWKRKVGGGIERAHKEVANSGTPSKRSALLSSFYNELLRIYVHIYFISAEDMICDGTLYGIRPLVACLPAWFRFAQCLRRYRDTKHAFPHLVNAGKYSTSFFVVAFSTLGKGVFLLVVMGINSILFRWLAAASRGLKYKEHS